MPITALPDATSEFVLDLTLPAPGDFVKSAGGASPIQVPFVGLLNSIEGARRVLLGGGIRRCCSSNNGTNIVILPLGAIVTVDGGVTKVIPHTATSSVNFSVAATAYGPPAALVANTRYYVYASIDAGAAVFKRSTTAPDSTLRYMIGDESQMFVTTFITDSAVLILGYTQTNSCFTYIGFTSPGAGIAGNLILDEGTATVVTGVAVNLAVPSLASSWICQIDFRSSNSGSVGFVGGVPSTGWQQPNYSATGVLQAQLHLSNQDATVFYRVANASFDTMSLSAAGFFL